MKPINLGTTTNPIKELMTDAGAQYHKGKEKLQTNSSHNDFVGKLLAVLQKTKAMSNNPGIPSNEINRCIALNRNGKR